MNALTQDMVAILFFALLFCEPSYGPRLLPGPKRGEELRIERLFQDGRRLTEREDLGKNPFAAKHLQR